MSNDIDKVIAVVEDDEPVLDAISMVLEGHGWHVAMFKTGEDFLADLTVCQPDVLLVDPHLPGINGAEVVSHLHSSLLFKSVPVIVFTAYPYSSEVTMLREYKVQDILLKPITEEVLLASLKRCQ